MKYLKIENLIKGILFTLVGFVLIGLSIYGWWNDDLTDIQAGSCMALGILFSMMRTKLDDIVIAFFKKFFGMDIGSKDKTPPMIIALLILASVSAYGQKYTNVYEGRFLNKPDSALISGVGQQRWDEANKKFRFGNGINWHSYWKTQGFTKLENTVDFLLDDQASAGMMYSWRFNDPVNGRTEATLASYGFDIQTKGGSFSTLARVDDTFGEFGSFTVSPIGFQMTYTYDGGTKNDLLSINSGGIKLGVVDDTHQVIIEGGPNFIGAIYNGDYSANFGSNSIPSVQWVNDQIAAAGGGGGWATTGTTALTGATVIDGAGNSLKFQNDSFSLEGDADPLADLSIHPFGQIISSYNGTNIWTLSDQGLNFSGTGLTENPIVAPSGGYISFQNGGATETHIEGGTVTAEVVTSTDVVATSGLTGPTGPITSGVYTPTLTGSTNVDAVVVQGADWVYMRVGTVVTVSGQINIDATTASTVTSVRVSLPIASNFANSNSGCAGTMVHTNSGMSGAVRPEPTNNEAQINFTPTLTSAQSYSVHFTYVII